MLREFTIVLFAMTAGFTVSGIVSNLYRIVAANKPKDLAGRTAYIAVMVVAGPNVLFENAAQSVRAKSCTKSAFWLAAAICAYWSFAIGLLVLNIVVAF